MTKAQHKRYLRFWGAAWSRHWCGVREGQPLARPGRPASPLRDQIVAVAGSMAKDSPLTADGLRHACHVVALGKPKSSLDLTNKEQDLVIAVFQSLAEAGHELAGQMRTDARSREVDRVERADSQFAEASGPPKAPWTDRRPDADRKRVLWSLDHSGYAAPAIAAISRDKFATENWKGLDDVQLYQLLLTVKRAAARQASSRASAVVQQRDAEAATTHA